MIATRYFYLDASALAKRYAPEIGSSVVDHLFARLTLDRLVVFDVGMAEVISILVRKRYSGKLSAHNFSQALIDFRAEITNAAAVRKATADTALVTSAFPLIVQHSINATDAILLRSTLDFTANLRPRGDDLALVASDGRLLRAAQAEGLTTFNPETQTTADLDSLLV